MSHEILYNSMILTVHTNWEYIHYNTLMISIEGKRQDQDTLVLKANNRKADITPNDYCTSIMD